MAFTLILMTPTCGKYIQQGGMGRGHIQNCTHPHPSATSEGESHERRELRATKNFTPPSHVALEPRPSRRRSLWVLKHSRTPTVEATVPKYRAACGAITIATELYMAGPGSTRSGLPDRHHQTPARSATSAKAVVMGGAGCGGGRGGGCGGRAVVVAVVVA